MLKWFKDCKTLEEAKELYKKLCREYHPDFNHDTDTTNIMKEINNEYEKAFNLYKNTHTTQHNDTVGNETTETTETPDMFKDIINKLIHCDGILILLIVRHRKKKIRQIMTKQEVECYNSFQPLVFIKFSVTV